jgi:Arc/MetJ-type ribon-helix-helix transcriptional regulator
VIGGFILQRDQTRTVELPESIVERVESRLPRTEFETSGEYIAYVMEEVLHEVETDSDADAHEDVDEDEVRDRLSSLGYLNE